MTVGPETINAAVPELMAPILAAGGTERGDVEEGVHKAMYWMDENTVFLGARKGDKSTPVFALVNGQWEFNHNLVREENYVNTGFPALVLPDVKIITNPAPATYPFTNPLITEHSGFSSLSLVGVPREVRISEIV
jgi:hypothetical protein